MARKATNRVVTAFFILPCSSSSIKRAGDFWCAAGPRLASDRLRQPRSIPGSLQRRDFQSAKAIFRGADISCQLHDFKVPHRYNVVPGQLWRDAPEFLRSCPGEVSPTLRYSAEDLIGDGIGEISMFLRTDCQAVAAAQENDLVSEFNARDPGHINHRKVHGD